jgi:hypothetical protein
VKTETSRKLMPIDEFVARELLARYEITPYKKPSDFVWATDANRAGSKRGKQPFRLSTVMSWASRMKMSRHRGFGVKL